MKRTSNIFVRSLMSASLTLGGASLAMAQVVRPDGTAEAFYGPALAIQNSPTAYGDNNLNSTGFSNGSELDQIFGYILDGVLYIHVAGNLESNDNKLLLFVDSVAGGQNRLRGDNAGSIVRMGDSGGSNGFTFDAGFDADHCFAVGINPGTANLYVNQFSFPTLSAGSDTYRGANATPTGDNVLTGGSNTGSMRVSVNNINAAGVTSATFFSASAVRTGVEFAIPLSYLGAPSSTVKVCAVINNGAYNNVSNQFLPGISSSSNLGEPRFKDLGTYAGNQFVTVPVLNLWAARIGSGATLNSSATAVSLQAFATSGSSLTALSTIAMPTSASGQNRAFTLSGTASNEGQMARSNDGRFVTLGGYDAATGTAAVSGTSSSIVNRVVTFVNAAGYVDTSSAFNTFSGNGIRSAYSLTGQEFWAAGQSNGVNYGLAGAIAVSSLNTSSANSRYTAVGFNQLYTVPQAGINSVGTGVPTSGTNATALLSGMTGSGTPNANQFAFYDANTIYLADERSTPGTSNAVSGGVQKWTYNGSTWVFQYSLNSGITTGCRSLCVTRNLNGDPVIFATAAPNTTGANSIYKVTDTGVSSAWSVLTTAGTGYVFRGVAFSPQPGDTNRPPTLDAIGTIAAVQELQNRMFTTTGRDPDGNSVSYSLTGTVPAGATINSSTGVFDWTPTEAQGPGTYNFNVRLTEVGAADLFVEQAVSISVTEVNLAPTANPQTVATNEETPVAITLTGADSDLPAQTLTYTVSTSPTPAQGTLSGTAPNLTFTPATNFTGPATFTFRANDGTANSAAATVTVNVANVNDAPTLAAITNFSINEGSLATFTAVGSDIADTPPNALTYSLSGEPAGAVINPTTGVFTWTPTEAQGPAAYTFDVVVTDNGTPNLSASRSITITVNEVNVAPNVTPIPNQSTDEMVAFTYPVIASDTDDPAQTLTYSLTGAPLGCTINSSGLISWTPAEDQGPQTYNFTVNVSDGTATTTTGMQIQVVEANRTPVWGTVPDQSASEFAPFALSLSPFVTDPDIPANTLSFVKLAGPTALTVSSGGAVAWTPGEADGGTSPTVTVRVTDNGSPTLFADQTFTINVAETNSAPTLAPIGNRTLNELQTLAFSAVGSDTDAPGQTLTYALVGAPAGAAINPGSGAFGWVPAENQGPGSFTFDVTVTDGLATASETITVTVNEVNVAPVWTPIVAQSATEGVAFSFNAATFASDSDRLPILSNNLTFSKETGPTALDVSSAGLVTWTPGELDGGTSPTVTVRVTDDGAPTLFADVVFTINVAEANSPPTWSVIPDQNATEGVAFSLETRPFASDSDIPAQALTIELVSGPAGLEVSPAGVVSWTPGETFGGTSQPVDIKVYDDTQAPLDGVTLRFSINVAEVNAAPALAAIPNQSVVATNPLTFTAVGSDPDDIPANGLTYTLVAGPDPVPAGAVINPTTGVFNWTPTAPQGPGVYNFKVRVTDNGTNPSGLFAEQPVQITVDASNIAPTANNASFTTNENTPVNTPVVATDPDVPAQPLTYTIVASPTRGVLSGTAPNYVYTPNLNYSGPDSFTFKVNDGVADSNVATVSLTVNDTVPLSVNVIGSVAPNAFGSPSFDPWAARAMTSLENTPGVDDGNRNLDPTAYDVVTTIPWYDNAATGTPFWMGTMNPLMPFNQELGHRIHFGVRFLGNGTRFSLSQLDFEWASSDGNSLGFTDTWSAADYYSANRKGIDYGPDRLKGTLDDIVYNVYAPDAAIPVVYAADLPIDELIYVGYGNAWDVTQEPGATVADQLASLRCYLEDMAPITISGTYKVRNGSGGFLGEGTGTVTLVPTNTLPTANSQSVSLPEDGSVGVTLMASDPDPFEAPLTYTILDAPDNGALSGTAPNLTYTPAANYNGPDSFTFMATDCVGDSNIATVTINVTPVNDDPILGAIGDRNIPEMAAYSFTLSSTDIDAGAPLYSATGLPTGATVTGNTFNWTPSEAQGPGSYPITFQVSDGAGGLDSETITITVNEVNVAPTLDPITDITAAEMTLITFDANGQDADLPGQTLTYSIVGAVAPIAGGMIDMNTGVFSWTPGENDGPGTYTVTVRVSDGTLWADRTLTITVTEANVAPVLEEIAEMTVNEGSPVTFTAHATDSDVPVQDLTYTIIPPPVGSTFDQNTGVFSWTPTEAQGPQTYTFTVRVSDGVVTDEQVVTIHVNEANVAPVALAQTLGTGVNAPLGITLVATDADLPANTLTYSIVSGPSNGVLSGTGASRTYTPNLNYQGPDSFTFKANDGSVDSNVATVNISVSGITVTLDLQLQSFLAAGPTTRGITMFLGGTDGGLSAPVEVTRDVVFTSTGYAQIVFTPADGFNANANLSEYAISIKDNLHSVRKTVPLTWNGSNYVASATLLGGNINRDNRIDIGDYVVYATRFGTVYPGADTPMSLQAVLSYRNADISGNGSVGTEDFTFISTNFGQGDNNLVGNYNRGDVTIRRRISVADAMIEAGREAARLDRNRDGWISLEEATQRLR